MNPSGVDSPGRSESLLASSRAALLDALEALEAHRDSVIVIGAQAIYLRASSRQVALAEFTKDSDLALDPRSLGEDPRVEEAMTNAGFHPNLTSSNPGEWESPAGIPVDLMVPEAVAGPAQKGRRGARIPPHSRAAARRAVGLEAALIDNDELEIVALAEDDTRAYKVRVAGLGALLVAKLHKLGDRAAADRRRLHDKDAHDVYRILLASSTPDLASKLAVLLADPLSREVVLRAMDILGELFAPGPDALGSVMAGRAEEGIGDPENVAQSVAILAHDLLSVLEPDQG